MVSSKSSSNPLPAVKNLFRGRAGGKGGNIWRAVSRAKASLAPNLFRELVDWIGAGPNILQSAVLGVPVRDYAAISPFRITPSYDLLRELEWGSAVLEKNVEKLSALVRVRANITAALFAGNNDLALQELDNLREQHGVSLWDLELRIAILQQRGGMEQQKAFVASITKLRRKGVIAFLTYWISRRNEETSNISRFINGFMRMLNGYQGTTDTPDFVSFWIKNTLPDDPKRLSVILNAASCCTLIDLFEMLVSVCNKIFLGPYDDRTKKAARRVVERLALITDAQITKLYALFLSPSLSYSRLPVRDVSIDNLLLCGKFSEAATEAISRINSGPVDSFLLNSAARALALAGETVSTTDCLRWIALEHLSAVYKKDQGWTSSFSELAKLSLNFRLLPGLGELVGFALLTTIKGLADRDRLVSSLVLASGKVEPHDFTVAASSVEADVRRICHDKFGQDLCWSYEALASGLRLGSNPHSGPGLSICPDYELEARVLAAIKGSDFALGWSEAQKLKRSRVKTFQLEGSGLAVFCARKADRLPDAVEEIADVCSGNEDARSWLSLPLIVQGVQWRDLRACAGNIALPIVLDLYLRDTEDEQQRTNLRYAYEEFLLKNQLTYPSDIADHLDQFPMAQLVYFLRHVAVQPVMDISVAFATSRQLDEERIKVCALLTELDSSNRTIYEGEVFELTKRLRIQEGLRTIDQSRVFVDAEALKRLAGRELKDQFARYRALAKVGLGGGASDFSEAMKAFLKKGAPLPREFLEVPSGEGDDVLVEIVFRLAREFLNNPEYGLEFFLSARVRHGSLSGHLRGPLEDRKLITLKDDQTNRYRPNDAWIEKITALSTEQQKRLNDAFSYFSQGYDRSIEKLTREILQISSPDKPRGVFKLAIGMTTLHALKDFVKDPEISFDVFLDQCFSFFWAGLKDSLDQVRAALQHFKLEAIEGLRLLTTKVNQVLNSYQSSELLRQISSAQTEIQLVLDRVGEWFLPSDRHPGEAVFGMDQVIDIAVEVARSARRGFFPKITSNISVPFQIGGESLASINDCIFVILDNVYQHSGVRNAPKITITASVQEDKKALKIRVESQVANGVFTQAVEEKLQRIRKVMFTGSEYLTVARTEGGSGLLKLRRMTSTLGPDALSFGFIDSTKFFVETQLPIYFLTIDVSANTRATS